MSENWQDWDSEDYLNFLEEFYTMQLNLAIAITVQDDDVYTIAVFDKLATPAVYLKAEYAKWKIKKGGKEAKGVLITHPRERSKPTKPMSPTPQPERWKQTKTEGTLWMSERDATADELSAARDPNLKNTWYMEPREGYEFGAIFKKEAK